MFRERNYSCEIKVTTYLRLLLTLFTRLYQ